MKLGLVFFLTAAIALSQTRGIVPEEIYQARQKGKAASAARATYVPVPSDQSVNDGRNNVNRPNVAALRPGASARQVGVTIWRLRPAAPGRDGARILVQDESHTSEWIPERISSTSSLKSGERVRLSIETPESGFLYVIDRERYRNGDRSLPYLIFPTKRTHGGDNEVRSARLIDIPAQDDRPNYFLLRPGREDQSEEELTVLLTPKPLEGLPIGESASKLTEEQVAQWERQWGARETTRFELTGGTGKAWTAGEQRAAAEGATRLLTQEDPPPQTVYRVAASPGDPVLVKVRLRYR